MKPTFEAKVIDSSNPGAASAAPMPQEEDDLVEQEREEAMDPMPSEPPVLTRTLEELSTQQPGEVRFAHHGVCINARDGAFPHAKHISEMARWRGHCVTIAYRLECSMDGELRPAGEAAFRRLVWRYKVAFAFCSPEDQFSRKAGRELAMKRLSEGQGIDIETYLDVNGQPLNPYWRPEAAVLQSAIYQHLPKLAQINRQPQGVGYKRRDIPVWVEHIVLMRSISRLDATDLQNRRIYLDYVRRMRATFEKGRRAGIKGLSEQVTTECKRIAEYADTVASHFHGLGWTYRKLAEGGE
jgi:hypothetical protein